jgi:hypothetical protein
MTYPELVIYLMFGLPLSLSFRLFQGDETMRQRPYDNSLACVQRKIRTRLTRVSNELA